MSTFKKILLLSGLVLGLWLLFSFYLRLEDSQKNLTAVVISKISLEHDKMGHPESSERVKSIIRKLNENGLITKVQRLPERLATKNELLLVHTPTYVESIFNWPKTKQPFFDLQDKWSAYYSSKMLASARSAVGSLIELSEAVANKKAKNGFAIIRPPGHHATPDKAMGFCIFNNIAIAAQNLLNKGLAQKILIVDIDAHYGNGVAEAFKNNPNVYYISHNQQFVFPYSDGTSTANIKDFKLKFLNDEKDHVDQFKTHVTTALDEFKPDFILVSAGYDAHWRDYMSNLSLTLKSYAEISKFLVQEAENRTQGKIVFSLEGGYDLEVLSIGVSNTIRALMNDHKFEDPFENILKKND